MTQTPYASTRTPPPTDAGWRALRRRFRGALLRPGEEGYDEARRTWNGAVDARPALVARCAGADDVVTALRFARERGLEVAVRGGGHSVVGHSTVDGGVVIDLSLMKAVGVDPRTRRVRAAAGVTWAELDAATQRAGLAVTGGTVSSVGVAGLTLGGGFGHLMRRQGLTVDHLVAVDLVTAEGRRLRVDAEHDPELFWAARGGGGNFGIATALVYEAQPLGPLLLAGPVYWPLEQAAEVLGVVNELAAHAPDGLGVAIVAHRAPPLPFVPPGHRSRPALGLLLSWSGDPERAEQALAPLRTVGSPFADGVAPIPYRALQTVLDGGAPAGSHSYWRSHRLPDLSGPVVDEVVRQVETAPSPTSLLNGWLLGGAAGRVDPDATAVGAREVGFELRSIALWRGGDADGERHRAWVRAGWERLAPYASGHQFVNFLADEGAAGVQAAYGDRLPRLRAVKDRLDPENVFHRNVNITPSRSTS